MSQNKCEENLVFLDSNQVFDDVLNKQNKQNKGFEKYGL